MTRKRTCNSVAEFEKVLADDTAALRKKLEHAVDETGEESVGIVWKRVPFAFGELHASVHFDKARRKLSADAPHAVPVEIGSPPHMPAVKPLQAWAALRGMVDPDKAGWAIAIKISKEGTRPTWFVRSSLPDIRRELDAQVRKGLGK